MKRKNTRLTFVEEKQPGTGARPAGSKTLGTDQAGKAKAKQSTRAPPKRGLMQTKPKSGLHSSGSARLKSSKKAPNTAAANRPWTRF